MSPAKPSPPSSSFKIPPPQTNSTGHKLPSFADVSVDNDDEPTPPPRSPPRNLTKADLPHIPPRAPVSQVTPPVENKNPQETLSSETTNTDPVDTSKKRTKDELRRECITEIYQTEKDYIDDLETMIDVC